jgi:hypothetical protein
MKSSLTAHLQSATGALRRGRRVTFLLFEVCLHSPAMTKMRALLLIVASWLLLTAPMRAALAEGPFDGLWRVRIMTQAGPCPGFRYPVQITDGRLLSAEQSGNSGTLITGSVDSHGQVRANVRRGVDRGEGQGQLSGNAGSGTWNSETRGCTGKWTAIRNQNSE